MAFLVKLRQSNKCGSVRNDEIINLHLGSGAALESASPASCKTPATSIDSICPNNQPGKKTKNPEMRSNSQQIVSYCLGLRTQNPGLREVDLEPSPKRGSDKIKMLKQGRKTQKKASRIVQPGHIWIPELREVDLEPSAKRGTSKTTALVSLY